MNAETIRTAIRDIPDFPKPGIIFKDITPILKDPALFKATNDILAEQVAAAGATKLAAIDARGFLFAGALSERLNIGIVPIRKQGKLPYKTYEETYDLEYGSATLAVHQDAFEDGERVVIIDDLLATGGTAQATARLVEQCGAIVAAVLFVVELAFLNGREKLADYTVFAPVVY
ncbi:MAG: adenine phosphoribosyltransferase [Kiritimatiellia bacterium]|jgi:adenine phosphoribosyltransferase|nr:adenine phosphoribosyltransferase [Kiritimatiellia bacterium]MDP6629840.1 adenine phosphoribosyltransferase [Kiritimatiellia bacterium]MDP6809737.1 adenine phosphoribosyltransferase [Kiritimatiellia bacterium]MDP7025153.1 adenine phosphoribosyltransferase [Kiritimatiellia bacterium]